MTKPSFVYVTYIATTPEKVWQALVDTDVTRKYWADPTSDSPGHVNVSDWKMGSQWEHQRLDDARTVDMVARLSRALLGVAWLLHGLDRRRPGTIRNIHASPSISSQKVTGSFV